VTAGGNAISVVGDSSTTGTTTTDPGTTDPGTTDPGTTDPGTTDPGDQDPGNAGGSGDQPGSSSGGPLPSGGSSGTDAPDALVASGLPSLAAPSLAMTGSDPWRLLLLAGLLLLLGAGVRVSSRRFVAVA
jgi:LPXTG-motif cell wall-anchored protein